MDKDDTTEPFAGQLIQISLTQTVPPLLGYFPIVSTILEKVYHFEPSSGSTRLSS